MTDRELRSWLITTAEAVRLADVTVDVIHQWRKRGYLNRYGSPRAALWDLREIAAAKVAGHGKRKKRHAA